ncbi:sensor histidine kinase [Paraburkholderia lycopersici]|uniref:histidine kinase n=1 Tax=Paraburkholderia lycopersici TaxID=416944 RepID=A0A1G6QT43_9BURK|nr:sensor histidine kinase [Paraburkholderia lycopersici]SDC95599.1 Signal transduction histidine kinase [Paraburkholderia lycopersici]
MTLSDFIEADLDGLIADWTEYARAISPKDSQLDDTQLRNSARELLTGIAADIRARQTDAQQHAKSHGERSDPNSAFNQIGRGHADDRQAHGFEINALVAEYRALRASVLRRWQQTCRLDSAAFQEMIRFNEAVDQMVAVSVRQFAQSTEHIRDLFAGVLAHDMRSPVGAILNSAHVLLRDENLSPTSTRAAANLQRSAERLKLLIDDLFIFTRTRLGDALPIEPTQQDFGRICHGAVEEVRAARPDAQIEVQATGELAGICDAARMNQLIVNLVTNAVQYGCGAVLVEAAGDVGQIVLGVSNGGPPIPATALPTLFDPLTRVNPSPKHGRASSGVGLGLYICRCIAHAHQGTIEVESDEGGTVFTAKIPRLPVPPH